MADKELKVKVTVDADVQPTLARLKELKQELREISTTDPKFKQKQQEIDDYTDALKAAKTGAGNFAEVLGTIPGPLGAIGNSIGGTLQSLKQFGALKFSDIKTSFTELGKDVIDAGKGLLQLTGITRAYEVVTAATSKALQFFGVSLNTANTAGKALGLTLSTLLAATGILAIVAAVDILTNAWDNFSKKAERAEEAQKKLNDSLLKGSKVALDAESARVKRDGDLLLAQAKARGANADEIYKIEQQNRKLLLAAQERYYNDLKNKDSDEAIAAVNNIKNTQNEIKIAEANFQTDKLQKSKQAADKNAQKNKAESDKEIADKKKALEDIAKNEKAAALSLLDEREQQKRKIVNDYNDQIKLAAANGADTVILEEAKLNALRILNDKFKKEDDDKQKEIDDKEKERLKKKTEDDIAAKVQEYENQISDLDAKNALIDNDFAEDLVRLETKKELLAKEKAEELSNTDLTLKERNEIIGRYADKERDIEKSITQTKKDEIRARTDIQMQYADFIQQFGNLLSSAAGKNKTLAIAGIIIEQGAALAKVIMSTQTANAAALATPQAVLTSGASAIPVILRNNIQGALSAAAIVVGAVKGISAINSAQIPGGSGGGGSAAAASAPPPAYSGAAVGMAAPQIQTTNATNPSTQIAQTLGTSQAPIKAYIVSGEVSSQQALDRRTSKAATFA